jgi:hypothetical protein
MLGVEAVDNILFGAMELTLLCPDIVNAQKNTRMQLRHSRLPGDARCVSSGSNVAGE